MPVMHRAVTDRTVDNLHAGANDVDVHYVEQAYAALHVTMAASRTASTQGSCHEVRALAREALAQQTTELVALTACLREWDRRPMLGPHPDAAALRGLEGTPFDQAFVAQLAAHALASKAAARTEVEGGVHRRARDIAQSSIRTHGLQQAAITRLARATASR